MRLPPTIEKEDWFRRNWKWLLPVGGVGLLAIGAGVVFLFVSLVFGAMKSSDAYKEAVAKASANSDVILELGQPIETGWFVTGKINVSGPSGEADLQIPISGPKGKGNIYAVATKSGGQWTFSKLHVEIDGTPENIDLLLPDR